MANSFKRKTSQNIGTSLTSIGSYTVPSATSTTVIGLILCNTTNNGVLANVSHYTGATDTYMLKNAPIPSGGSLIIVGGDQKVVLEVGDSIRVQSNTASSIDVVMSVLEIS